MKEKIFGGLLAFIIVAGVAWANDYYNATGSPSTSSSLSSAVMRNEFALIEDGFDKQPAFAGNGGKYVRVNAGETALEAVAGSAVGGDHNIADHADTTATGAELETLTDGSDAAALHTHSTYLPLAGGTMSGDIATASNIKYNATGPRMIMTATGWYARTASSSYHEILLQDNGSYGELRLNAAASHEPLLSFYSNGGLRGSINTTTGITVSAVTDLYFYTRSSSYGVALAGTSPPAFYPIADGTHDLGSSSKRWKKAWFVDQDTTNAEHVSSDEKLKKNIKPLDDADVSFIYTITPIEFKWKDESKGKEYHYGFTAQDIEAKKPAKDSWIEKKTLKEGGDPKNPDDYIWTISPSEFIGPMVKVIQKQNTEIDLLKARLDSLEARVGALEHP